MSTTGPPKKPGGERGYFYGTATWFLYALRYGNLEPQQVDLRLDLAQYCLQAQQLEEALAGSRDFLAGLEDEAVAGGDCIW